MTNPMLLKFMRNQALPLRLRKKVGKFIGSPQPGTRFKIKVFDALFEGETGSHQDDKIFYYGAHEPATLRLMRDIMEYQAAQGMDPVYLDIGTNIGQHLIAVASKARYAYGFEPWSKVRDEALKNLALNDFGHVQVLPFGLSDVSAQLPYFPPVKKNLGCGSFMPEAENVGKPITLEVRKGDDVVGELGIKPTLLKIDTEGFEQYVLRGLHDTIAAHKPAVVFELGDLSRKDFETLEDLYRYFPRDYSFHGIMRSCEKPHLEEYNPDHKYENLLAWPEADFKLY